MPYANNKGADQPAHPHSLISAFVVEPCLDSRIPLVSISEISSLYLASVAEQAGLSLPWSQTPKTGFLVTRLIIIQRKRYGGHRRVTPNMFIIKIFRILPEGSVYHRTIFNFHSFILKFSATWPFSRKLHNKFRTTNRAVPL